MVENIFGIYSRKKMLGWVFKAPISLIIRSRVKWFGTFNNINSAKKLITISVLAITQN